MEYRIKLDNEQSRFNAIDEKGVQLGELDYIIEPNNKMRVTHTGVKPEYGGLGIAAALNKEAILFAKTNNYTIIADCSYTESYIKKHPEYESLLD